MAIQNPEPKLNPRRRIAAAVVLALLASAALWHFGPVLERELVSAERWIAGLGHWAWVAYLGLYAVLIPLGLSEGVLLVAAGVLFGAVEGIGLAMLGIVLASAVIFFVARRFLAVRVAGWASGNARLAAIRGAVANGPWTLLFWLRVPPLPFAVLSYTVASAGVRLRPYLLSNLGRLPEVALTVAAGAAMRRVSTAAAGTGARAADHAPLIVGLVLSLVAAAALWRMARRALHEAGIDA